MSIEKPLDLATFRAPVEQEQEAYIAIEMANHQDVDGITLVRHRVDMFGVTTKLIRSASAAEHDLTRPYEEPRIVFEVELADKTEPEPDKRGGQVLDMQKLGANACAVSERPKPFVRYIFVEERLVRVEHFGIGRDSIPTLTRRWAQIIESQLVRPGEVPEMIVGEDENAAGGTQIREGDGQLDCG